MGMKAKTQRRVDHGRPLMKAPAGLLQRSKDPEWLEEKDGERQPRGVKTGNLHELPMSPVRISDPGRQSRESRFRHDFSEVPVHNPGRSLSVLGGPAPPEFRPFPEIFPQSPPAQGVAQNGRIAFRGIPSIRLFGHELIHVAQQHLGAAGYSEAPRTALEDEAERLGPKLASEQTVPVQYAASPNMPLFGQDPDLTYITKDGYDPYLQAAYEFHEKWGYAPRRVGSLEAVTDDLASGKGNLDRIRIVSHASVVSLYMPFAEGGPNEILETELRAHSLKEAAEAAVVTEARYAEEDAMKYFRGEVVSKDKALAKRLGVKADSIKTTWMRDYFRWLVNKHRVQNIAGLDQEDRTLLLAGVDKQLNLAQETVRTNNVDSAPDLEILKRVISGTAFAWTPLGPSDALQEPLNRIQSVSKAFTVRGLADKRSKMRARFWWDSTIEIRGCALGQNRSYMEAVQSYFGHSVGGAYAVPAIDAPDWYQYYGHVNIIAIEDNDKTIKFYWEKWRHRKELRASFKQWAKLFAPEMTKPEKSYTWEDLRDYLRKPHPHALPLRNGTNLLTLKEMNEDQIIDWLSKNDQRLRSAVAIKGQFEKQNIADLAGRGHIIQWLQSEFGPSPKSKLFSFDPRWRAHIVTLPGRIHHPFPKGVSVPP